jgi:glycerol uptake facilitator-like aquaporin
MMARATPPWRALVAEAAGTALLVACVIGSGVMGSALSGGNAALALLGNTLATVAMLYVLISVFARVSGAHFNPAVSLVLALTDRTGMGGAALYALAQVVGAALGAVLAHAMFELPLVSMGTTARAGAAQALSEVVASFALVLTILGLRRARPDAVAAGVAAVIGAGYCFTASTSFANPAVTLARALSDTFAGIRPEDAPAFILAQVLGALAARAFDAAILAKTPD